METPLAHKNKSNERTHSFQPCKTVGCTVMLALGGDTIEAPSISQIASGETKLCAVHDAINAHTNATAPSISASKAATK